MKRTIPALFLPALLLLAPAVAQENARAVSESARKSLEAVTPEQLRDYVTFLASDELEGRDTPSRGLDVAARFLATSLSRAGLKPAGENGTYFQRLPLVRASADLEKSTARFGERTFRAGADFLPAGPEVFARAVEGTATGQLVYAGHGWVVKSKNLDPYAGLDVKDRILVLQSPGMGLPKGITREDLAGKQGEDWEDPASFARRNGARGIVWIPGFVNLARWDRAIEAAKREILGVDEPPPAPPLPSITASVPLLTELFNGEKHPVSQVFARAMNGDATESFAFQPQKTFSFTVAVKRQSLESRNVVAVLEGSDPVLKNEYVAFGAHYDHVGMREMPDGRDGLYNGADDDASGTAALLAIAEAFARTSPKRSLLFVWHAGEEHGLWGSKYFVDHPTVPLDKVVAQLNIDMIGRSKKPGDENPRNRDLSGPNEVYLIGSKMMSDELGALSERVNSEYLNIGYNYRYDDPQDPNRFFFRSDHINYARKGIPIIFYFTGVHEDYHRPSDTADKLDYEKMTRITRTIGATAAALADAPQRPKVDRPLPASAR